LEEPLSQSDNRLIVLPDGRRIECQSFGDPGGFPVIYCSTHWPPDTPRQRRRRQRDRNA
jgi:hypothetical protein